MCDPVNWAYVHVKFDIFLKLQSSIYFFVAIFTTLVRILQSLQILCSIYRKERYLLKYKHCVH